MIKPLPILLIVGCGGHARSVANVLIHNGELDFCFLDEQAKPHETIFNYPCWKQLSEEFNAISCKGFIAAIGDNKKRAEKFNFFKKSFLPCSVIAKSAIIGAEAIIENGTFIAHAAQIGPLSQINENTIINTSAVIEHEVVIGKHSHISINAAIGGRTHIGESVFIGAGATVIDSINICHNVTIGAGAVVVKDIQEPGTYLGIPAKKIKLNESSSHL